MFTNYEKILIAAAILGDFREASKVLNRKPGLFGKAVNINAVDNKVNSNRLNSVFNTRVEGDTSLAGLDGTDASF